MLIIGTKYAESPKNLNNQECRTFGDAFELKFFPMRNVSDQRERNLLYFEAFDFEAYEKIGKRTGKYLIKRIHMVKLVIDTEVRPVYFDVFEE